MEEWKKQARTLTINNNHKTRKVVNPRTKQKQYSYKKTRQKSKEKYYIISLSTRVCKCVGVFIIVSILKNIYNPEY